MLDHRCGRREKSLLSPEHCSDRSRDGAADEEHDHQLHGGEAVAFHARPHETTARYTSRLVPRRSTEPAATSTDAATLSGSTDHCTATPLRRVVPLLKRAQGTVPSES